MPPWSCPRCGTVNAGESGACVACATPNPAFTTVGQPPVGAPPAPAPQYGQPAQQYGAPPPPYGQPAQQYGAPPSPYGPPTQQFGAPQQPYGQPPPSPGTTVHGLQPQRYGQPQQQYPPPQFGAPAPPSPGYPPPGPPGWGAPPPAPGGGNRALLIGVAAAVAVVAAVVAIVLLTRGSSSPAKASATASPTARPTPSATPKPTPTPTSTPSALGAGTLILPDTIAGESKVNDPSLQASLQAQADSVRRAGASGAVAGAYGTDPSSPDRAVFAASGAHPSTPDFTHYLATQFAGGAGVTLDEASMKSIDENGTTMSCWTLSQSAAPVGAYCGWNDVVTVGFSVQFGTPDLQTCADFTAAARTAVLNQG